MKDSVNCEKLNIPLFRNDGQSATAENISANIMSKQRKSMTISGAKCNTRICWTCGNPGGSLLRCSGCRKARYCGEACYREDWGRHREWCGKRRERREKRRRKEILTESLTQTYNGEMDEDD